LPRIIRLQPPQEIRSKLVNFNWKVSSSIDPVSGGKKQQTLVGKILTRNKKALRLTARRSERRKALKEILTVL
jgi:hypothetical protein